MHSGDVYSHLPNKRAGRNKQAGLYFFTKFDKHTQWKLNIVFYKDNE